MREKRVPTIPQILRVIRAMPSAGEIDRRNRALIAFTLLTGARDGAIVSLKLKHVDFAEGKVVQDAREVKTKFSKSFTTWFFPVGEEALQIVVQWIEFLTSEKLFGPDDLGAGRNRKAPGARKDWPPDYRSNGKDDRTHYSCSRWVPQV